MKLKDKIRNEHGVVTINNLRSLIHETTQKLTRFGYMTSKDVQKKIDLVVEYYIMSYYRLQNMDGFTLDDIAKDIEFAISIVMDLPIYPDVVDKKYEDVLWWVIYQLTGFEDVHMTSDLPELSSRIIESINMVELGEYPESSLESFHKIQLEECITQLYQIIMASFMYDDDFNF